MDFQFCDDARRAGFRLWCDTSLTRDLVHLGESSCRLTEPSAEVALKIEPPPHLAA